MDNINPQAKKQIRTYFQQLRIMFFAVAGGVFLFALAIWLITGYGAQPMDVDIDGTLRFATPISTIALILLSFLLYSGRIKPARQKEKMFEKMEGYRAGWLLRMMVLDGAGILNLISFIFTCNELYYYLLGAILFLFIMNYPSPEKFIRELQLNSTEERVIRDHIV